MFSSLLIAMSLLAAQPGGQPTTTTTTTTTTPTTAKKKLAEPAPAPIITLYTMGRGELMVEKFGHAALCVKYRAGINELGQMCEFPSSLPPQGVTNAIRKLWIRLRNWPDFKDTIEKIDPKWGPAAYCIWRHRVAMRNRHQQVCYNYGTTDFTDPVGLGWGFLRGRSKFWVDPQFFSSLFRIYSRKDRSLWKQVLPLKADKAWATARKLEHDVLDENKYYNYHHFYDNCTTRVRDIVNDAVDGKLKVGTDGRVGITFREFGGEGFADATWLQAISDFLFGRGGDVKPTLWQAMFLPRIMREEIEQRVGIKAVLVYKRKGPAFNNDPGNWGRHWTFLFIVLFSFPLIASVIWGRFPRVGVWTASVVLAFVALLVWALAGVSTLYELRVNEACLLFWPTDAALPFLTADRRKKYARIRVGGVVLVSFLLVVGLFRQPLWMPILLAFVPLFTMSRLWELIPQVAARAEEKRKAAEEKTDETDETDEADEADDKDESKPKKKSTPNVAAMQAKKNKKSKKRKR